MLTRCYPPKLSKEILSFGKLDVVFRPKFVFANIMYDKVHFMHWSEINPNPDNHEVVRFRNEKVKSSYGPSINAYEDVIKVECSGKEVIDFGAANHNAGTSAISGIDTHSLVVKFASKVTAIDIVEFSQICPSKCSHFVGDFLGSHDFPFEKSDVIFAGHVIEHLDAPHKLFEFASKALNYGGQIIVVTPNPLWFVGLFYRSKGENNSVNADHVAIFGASELIEIGERSGFEIVEWCYSGKADMGKKFIPGGKVTSRIMYGVLINFLYRISRVANLAFSHNQIVAIFKKVN
jgi:2-polyprenyl-3-methyl-5-hydroxy-6-metoxy-1,4-benzoquinol methylase